MEEINEWVMTLCACAVVLSLSEVLLPDGAVKKTAYLVLSLIAVSCLASPLGCLGEFTLDLDLTSYEQPSPYTDWLLRPTEREFAENVAALIKNELSAIGVNASEISVSTVINDDGSVSIEKAKIMVDERYSDRFDEIESVLSDKLGIQTDITVKRRKTEG